MLFYLERLPGPVRARHYCAICGLIPASWSFFGVGGPFRFAYEFLHFAQGFLCNARYGELWRLGGKTDRELRLAHRLIGVAPQLVRRTGFSKVVECSAHSPFELINRTQSMFLKTLSGGFDGLFRRVDEGVDSLLDLFNRLANDLGRCFRSFRAGHFLYPYAMRQQLNERQAL